MLYLWSRARVIFKFFFLYKLELFYDKQLLLI